MADPIRWFKQKLRSRRQLIIASPIGEEDRPGHYPDGVKTTEQRKRWDVARLAAIKLAQDIEGDKYTVYLATRSLYHSDIPTE